MTDLLRLSKAIAIAAGALAALFAGPGFGTTITVNSVANAVNAGDGVCTLREAIVAANTNAASGGVAGECAAGQAGPTEVEAIRASTRRNYALR